ncbi:hypothetical protein C8Q75DRAFT_728968 [Abortiporus biennis]|nr:hypothetical protein C8Q75DRAFT_728968 [Abortiporus biennis]
MEWWSIFYKVRKVVFEWNSFGVLQRSIVIGIIAANFVTSVMQYLMMVMIFRFWADFSRMLFLVSLHLAAAVLFSLFGSGFSCVVWPSQSICQVFDLTFLITAWTIAGFKLSLTLRAGVIYTICLCIMSRVHHPAPRVTPNDLLITPTRRGSTSSFGSMNSATGLLRTEKEPNWTDKEAQLNTVRTVPKQMFVGNRAPSPGIPQRNVPRMRGGSYGAMGSPRMGPTPNLIGRPLENHRPSPSAFRPNQNSRPTPLPLSNPFADPVPRNGTPGSMFNALNFGPAGSLPSRNNTSIAGSIQPYPSQVPPLTGIQEARAQIPKAPDSPSSIYSLYSNNFSSAPKEETVSDNRSNPAYLSSYQRSATMPTTLSVKVPPRTHTATPYSIHSVAPSVHLSPRSAHFRAMSDPVYRPYTASPRLIHQNIHHQQQPSATDVEIDLPNPFPMIGGEVRRFASSGNSPYQQHQRGLSQNSYLSATIPNIPGPLSPGTQQQKRVHFEAALGRTPPRTLVPPPDTQQQRRQEVPYRPARGANTMDRGQWKQLVLNAAASGRPAK